MDEKRQTLFLPPEAAALTLANAERLAKYHSVLTFGLPLLDTRGNPGLPGNVYTFLARPGMGKTTLSTYLCRRWSQLVAKTRVPGQKTPIVVFCTTEATVEECKTAMVSDISGQTLADVGRGTADLQRLSDALVLTIANNVAIIGQSEELQRQNPVRGMYHISTQDLDNGLDLLRGEGYPIAAVFVDYLQRFGNERNRPFATTQERISGVGNNMSTMKSIAMAYGTTVAVCAQAVREVDSKSGLKLPDMGDGQWASTIEQDSDKMYSLTMPDKYYAKDQIGCAGLLYDVTPNLIAIAKLKERYAPCDGTDVYMCEVDPRTALFSPAIAVGEIKDEPDF